MNNNDPQKTDPNDAYPAHGPQVERPLRVRVLRIASLVLAFAGLILLYLYSTHREIPVVRAGEITPTMNFAYVRIRGEVTRDAYLFKSGGLIFNVHDGSGEIAVMGGRTQADVLKETDRLPRRGDQVDVAGSLSVGADRDVKLRMQSAEQLLLVRRQTDAPGVRPVETVHLRDVTAGRVDERLTVRAVLRAVDVPPPGSNAPYKLTLEQDGVERVAVFWEDVFREMQRTLPSPGETLLVNGQVDEYRGTVQIKVWDASDLRAVSALKKKAASTAATTGTIAGISAAAEGEVFTVTGTLGEPRSIRGGVIYPLRDESGEIALLFWDNQVSGEERDALEAGVRVRVSAPLKVYKGTLELIPEDAGGFTVLEEER